MNILCVGDIVGKAGRTAFIEKLPEIKAEYSIDFVVVNAENAAGGSGVTPKIAKQLFSIGSDVLTMGDHVWDRPELVEFFEEEHRVLRPANFPEDTPGSGWCIVETSLGKKIGVINLLGRVFMKYTTECPFRALKPIVKKIREETNIIIVDFHAEATSEKIALGFFVDGKVSAVVGTYTHVQTADEKILPKGTAYITDLGMAGPQDSVIGQKKELIIQRFLSSMPVRFEVAKDDVWINGAVIEVDENTGLASNITRLQRRIQ